MRNFEIARLFYEMADLLEVGEESLFRIRAYRRAAQNIESLAEDGPQGRRARAFGAALQYFTGSQAHNIRVRELASRFQSAPTPTTLITLNPCTLASPQPGGRG